MIATRFRSVYWVGGVAVAALGCYLVSQRVAAERQNLARVETEIAMGERQIRALETEIGTRAGMNQIERWNTEVLSLSAPKAGQFMASEVQLASLTRPVVPAMEAPAAVQLASAPGTAPEPSSSPISRVSYQTTTSLAEPEPSAPAVVRTSYTKVEPAKRAEPARPVRKAAAATPAKAKAEPTKKPERSAAKTDAKKSAAKPKAETRPERTAQRERKAEPVKAAKRVADRKTEDNAARVRPAIYVKPKAKHQSVALLDDKLVGDLGRLAQSERTGGKRSR
jgi:hypothetical protein